MLNYRSAKTHQLLVVTCLAAFAPAAFAGTPISFAMTPEQIGNDSDMLQSGYQPGTTADWIVARNIPSVSPPPPPPPPPPQAPPPPPPPSFNSSSLPTEPAGFAPLSPTDTVPTTTGIRIAPGSIPVVPPAAYVDSLLASQVAGELLVSTSNCSATAFPDLGRAYVQGAVGTVYGVTTERTLLLKDGRMLVGAGDVNLQVTTSAATVNLRANTVALIDAQTDKPVRVTILDGDGAQVKTGADVVADLQPGNEAVVADHALADEELIPIDGVNRVDGTIVKEHNNVRLNKLSVAQLIAADPLLNLACHLSSNDWPYNKLKKTYGTSVASIPPHVSEALPASTFERFEPVAYFQSAAAPGCRIQSESEFSEVTSNHYRLDHGRMLICPLQTTTVDTANGSVVIRSHAAAIVTADHSQTRVLDLVDHGANQVTVSVDNKVVGLMPGKEAGLVSEGKIDSRKLIFADGIGRRRMRIVSLPNQTRLVLNDASLADAINKYQVLRQLKPAKDAADRALLKNITKMSAIVALTGRAAGPYSSAEQHW